MVAFTLSLLSPMSVSDIPTSQELAIPALLGACLPVSRLLEVGRLSRSLPGYHKREARKVRARPHKHRNLLLRHP